MNPMSKMARHSPDTTSGSESELLDRVAGGDRDAIADLYRIYQPRLFKFVFRLTRSYAESDELVNDTMLVVWRKASTFRRDSKVSTWIFGIAYRQSLQRMSRRQLRIASSIDPDEFPGESDGAEDRDWIRHGLMELPPAQRLAVVLVFYAGLSYEEVADVSDCPVNTVKTRMYHARRKLRDALVASQQANEPQGDSDD